MTIALNLQPQIRSHLSLVGALTGSLALHFCVLAFLLLPNENQLISSPLGESKTSRQASVHFVTFDKAPAAIIEGTVPTKAKKEATRAAEPRSETPPSSQATTGSTTHGTPSGIENAGALAEYLFELRQLIEERKIYPSLSRRMGEAGRVLITLEVLRDGAIQSVQLKSGSKFSRLNEAALETVSSVKRYKPLPDSVTNEKLSVEVPIEFSL